MEWVSDKLPILVRAFVSKGGLSTTRVGVEIAAIFGQFYSTLP